MWFIFALAATLGWGLADLFYKKSSDEEDRYSHLKLAVWVGLVMGVCSLALIPFSDTFVSGFSFAKLFENALKYSPASLGYIISMVIGYAGLRYLELSVVSPVQNASGALSCIAMSLWFLAVGRIDSINEEFSILDMLGTLLIAVGVVALAIAEKKLSEEKTPENKKYRLGALALIFPLLYCLFDTVGTAADGIILDEETGIGLSEIDVLIVYGITFLLFGLCAYAFMLFKTKKAYNPFALSELKTKAPAALFEEAGQITYVFAMAQKPVLAAPMIASYCIVSVILSRVFLKEKLSKPQYLSVLTVIFGIVLLGISEGIASI